MIWLYHDLDLYILQASWSKTMMCFVIGRVKIIVNWKKHLLVIYCFLLPYLNLDFHSLEKLKGLYFAVTIYFYLLEIASGFLDPSLVISQKHRSASVALPWCYLLIFQVFILFTLQLTTKKLKSKKFFKRIEKTLVNFTRYLLGNLNICLLWS